MGFFYLYAAFPSALLKHIQRATCISIYLALSFKKKCPLGKCKGEITDHRNTIFFSLYVQLNIYMKIVTDFILRSYHQSLV